MSHEMFTVSSKLNSADVVGLPTWLVDGDLFAGRVDSASTMRQGMPGMPMDNLPIPVGFARMVNNILEGTAGCGWNSRTAIAEDTINGRHYAICYDGNRIRCSCDGMKVKKSDIPASLIFLLSLPTYLKEKEFASALAALQAEQDDEQKKKFMAILGDDAYTMDDNNPITASFFGGNPLGLTSANLSDPRYIPAEQFGAAFNSWPNTSAQANSAAVKVANGGSIDAVTTVMDPKDFNGKYAVVKPEDLTAEERTLVPELDDSIVLSAQHMDVCETIQKSLGGKHPFCNFLFRGQPGCGKSTFVKVVAAGLGLPFYQDVMKVDMDADFFSGYFAPNCETGNGTDSGKTLAEFLAEFPSAEDMAFDPVNSYKLITGKDKTDATAEDCTLEMNARTVAFAKQCVPANNESGKQALVFIEGLVPKLERPCVVFYDEVTAPRNPAAITALNTLMDRQRVFTLSNGHVVHRHPLSVMCFAGNFSEDGIELEGAHDPNRTWQDRNNEVINIQPLGPAELKGMLIADTGWNETDNGNIPIDMYVTVMPELQKICADYYGVCGFRAVADWLAKSMLIGSPVRAAETTIIPKATNNADCAAELRMKIKNRFSF